ncbi:UDP-glycosyltransferase 91C1 [Prunus yedoensis var. nudiflora]|uniref:UDP-glycosyltransferase 91C1 n=1 Tax=Prunus yedoensis var. nudiflora TaxID=2094558 RepID=A0A314YS24_PRUYE|nr:UDP-glycosyltransferase 91C1 [Prunus yedoensis var. nudiflora]
MLFQFLDRHKINTTPRASSTSIPVSFHGEGEEEWSSSCGGVSMAGHGPPHTLLPSLQAHSSKGSLCFFHLHPKKHSQTSQNTLTPLFSHQTRFLPLPRLDNLPNEAESATDVPYNKQLLLKRAFDLLELPLTDSWVAARFDISRAFFSCFNAATLAYIGPPAPLINGQDFRTKAEDFTLVPEWSHSSLTWRTGFTRLLSMYNVQVRTSPLHPIRSSDEFEPEWFNLLRELYGKGKPVVPVGVARQATSQLSDLHPVGPEATLSQEELTELALGLELSGVPFFWVLRNPPESTQSVFEMLPHGFVERVEGRGVVHLGWAPQVLILSHDSVGGFLTHCGWNSMIEGLGFGRVLILFPMVNDQGLNARLGNNKGLGVEIPRIAQDGSFTCDSVAKLVRLAMVEDSGESLRIRAKEMKGLFGDRNRNNQIAMNSYAFLKRIAHQG